jgi:hypothetical protein
MASDCFLELGVRVGSATLCRVDNTVGHVLVEKPECHGLELSSWPRPG